MRLNVNGIFVLLFYYAWHYFFVRLQEVRPCSVLVWIPTLDILGQCNDGGPGAIHYSNPELKMYNKSENNRILSRKNAIKGK